MSDTAEKVTHSPLPWTAVGCAIEGPFTPKGRISIGVVCESQGRDTNVARANAEFIVRCVNHHAELVDALTKLAAEVTASIGLAEYEMRAALGHTNVNVLRQRLEEARSVLAKVQ